MTQILILLSHFHYPQQLYSIAIERGVCRQRNKMVFVALSQILFVLASIILAICLCLLTTLTYFWWILPNHKLQNLKKCGFDGPTPSFPFGNIKEMKRNSSFSSSLDITHNIHSTVSLYYSSWQKSFGKLRIKIYFIGINIDFFLKTRYQILTPSKQGLILPFICSVWTAG